jgi:hypothetical protein
MKFVYLVTIGFLFFACEEPKEVQDDKDDKDEKVVVDENKETVDEDKDYEKTRESLLIRRWKFNERKSQDGKSSVTYGDQSSDVVMRLEANGFYMVYDSITDKRIIDKGVRTLEQRHSGQWNLIDENTLVLQRIGSDTILFDTLNIDKLDSEELVTTTRNKNKITYYSID